jgi:hypothetical protein
LLEAAVVVLVQDLVLVMQVVQVEQEVLEKVKQQQIVTPLVHLMLHQGQLIIFQFQLLVIQ